MNGSRYYQRYLIVKVMEGIDIYIYIYIYIYATSNQGGLCYELPKLGYLARQRTIKNQKV
jgi:hypothetical protein